MDILLYFKFDLCKHVFNRRKNNLVFENQVIPKCYVSFQCQSKAFSCTRKIAVGFWQVETRRARKDSKIARVDVSINFLFPLNTCTVSISFLTHMSGFFVFYSLMSDRREQARQDLKGLEETVVCYQYFSLSMVITRYTYIKFFNWN